MYGLIISTNDQILDEQPIFNELIHNPLNILWLQAKLIEKIYKTKVKYDEE